MRLTEVLTSDHRIRYVVLDDQGELVAPLAKYLKHLDQRGYALNTLRSYGTSLMLFFEYLNQREADFRQITLDTLAGFVSWLRWPYPSTMIIPSHPVAPARCARTINHILTAVASFYDYLWRIDEISVDLNAKTRAYLSPRAQRYKGFLYHSDIGGEIQKASLSDKIKESVSYHVQNRRLMMSMKPQPIPEIPAETVRVVRAAEPSGNIYIHLRDTLGTIYQDELFADLYPDRGQPAYAPWRLALVTVFQFMENLTDRQAADAVRSRLDLKDALSRELTDAGFDHTVLSEFRTRLVAHLAEERFLEAILMLCKEHGWLKAGGRQRTDSTHVLAKIRALNRAECVVETLRHALNVLAVVAPDWLRGQVQPEWLERYESRASEYRFPSGEDKRQQFLHQVGQDGWGLLTAITADPTSHWMLSIPAIDTLQRVWKQDYLPLEQGGTWIADEDRLEAARVIYSPYDLDASAAKKRSTYWIGYKVHFTETCDEDMPRLITHVATDIGPIPDREALPDIHVALQQQELLPEKHLVDAGYVDAESLVASQKEYQIDLVGPTAKDQRWQAREQNGYALSDFSLDWEHEQARCPQGYTSRSWTPTTTRNQEVIKIKFGYATCGGCPVRSQCTQSRQRTLTVRRREAHFALEAARQREQTEEFAEVYDQRAGIEGVHAQGVRRMGLRRSRYIGEPRTHLQHVVTATAINVCRLFGWLAGVSPHSTQISHFARFMKEAA